MVDRASSTVETLRWRNQRIEMIDQRILPGRIEYPGYDSAAGVAEAASPAMPRPYQNAQFTAT